MKALNASYLIFADVSEAFYLKYRSICLSKKATNGGSISHSSWKHHFGGSLTSLTSPYIKDTAAWSHRTMLLYWHSLILETSSAEVAFISARIAGVLHCLHISTYPIDLTLSLNGVLSSSTWYGCYQIPQRL